MAKLHDDMVAIDRYGIVIPEVDRFNFGARKSHCPHNRLIARNTNRVRGLRLAAIEKTAFPIHLSMQNAGAGFGGWVPDASKFRIGINKINCSLHPEI